MLTLNADRSITVDLGEGRTALMRPPTISEWRKIREVYTAALTEFVERHEAWEAERAAHNQAGDPEAPLADEPTQSDVVWSDGNPVGRAFATVLEMLAGLTIDADNLPMWATDRQLPQVFHDQWATVLVVRHNETAPTPPGPAGPVGPSQLPPLPPAVQAGIDAHNEAMVAAAQAGDG